MNAVLRCALLLLICLVWPSATSPASALPHHSIHVGCAYDTQEHDVLLADAGPESGPPVFTEIRAGSPAVGSGSSGTLKCARDGAGATALAFTDDGSTPLAKAARSEAPELGAPQATVEDLSPRSASHVAAEGVSGMADEASALLGNADDVVVLGRQADTAVANGWDGHVVLNTPNWSLELNDTFIRGAIDQGRRVYLASPTKGNLIQTSGPFAGQPTVYPRELQMLREAGYTRSGDYMVPR